MSKIEWTGQTWNPLVGCSLASPGCTHCYAMTMAARIALMNPNLAHYHGLTKPSKAGPVWTGKIARAPEKTITEPLRRRKPTMYFVNSMSDLFHEDVPDDWIDRVFAVMALCPQHTFQVLTKRSARMRAYLAENEAKDFAPFGVCKSSAHYRVWDEMPCVSRDAMGCMLPPLPLPNVWLGVSAEDQRRANERIPDLLATPAAVRFVSAEPLLGPIDFSFVGAAMPEPGNVRYNALTGHALPYDGVIGGIGVWATNKATPCAKIDWIIVGGESGPHARPMHPDWARAIRDQCNSAEVPFFFKQWGEWAPGENVDRQRGSVRVAYKDDPFGDAVHWSYGSELLHVDGGHIDDEPTLYRVGKVEAGRLLDGITWDEMPECSGQQLTSAAAGSPQGSRSAP